MPTASKTHERWTLLTKRELRRCVDEAKQFIDYEDLDADHPIFDAAGAYSMVMHQYYHGESPRYLVRLCGVPR